MGLDARALELDVKLYKPLLYEARGHFKTPHGGALAATPEELSRSARAPALISCKAALLDDILLRLRAPARGRYWRILVFSLDVEFIVLPRVKELLREWVEKGGGACGEAEDSKREMMIATIYPLYSYAYFVNLEEYKRKHLAIPPRLASRLPGSRATTENFFSCDQGLRLLRSEGGGRGDRLPARQARFSEEGRMQLMAMRYCKHYSMTLQDLVLRLVDSTDFGCVHNDEVALTWLDYVVVEDKKNATDDVEEVEDLHEAVRAVIISQQRAELEHKDEDYGSKVTRLIQDHQESLYLVMKTLPEHLSTQWVSALATVAEAEILLAAGDTDILSTAKLRDKLAKYSR
ncbi:hypothetical protein SELMODRAFT_419445 [Selaginella moellendorffii]|uniref:Uncharacterized protein n=1 Tax=Selaginella moellendorffii TaxID=88036 RepID=D8S8Z5_SELML|nr:hypothetical protein SELMODRAFT_419445 [Selaginella moellendorffii]